MQIYSHICVKTNITLHQCLLLWLPFLVLNFYEVLTTLNILDLAPSTLVVAHWQAHNRWKWKVNYDQVFGANLWDQSLVWRQNAGNRQPAKCIFCAVRNQLILHAGENCKMKSKWQDSTSMCTNLKANFWFAENIYYQSCNHALRTIAYMTDELIKM